MPEFVVEAAELKKEAGRESLKKLAEFLKEKLNVDVEATKDQVLFELEDVTKKYLRVLLRKFLHQNDLKEDFRVISGGENVLIVKERKKYIIEE